jgi:DNA-binding transcriptional regulator WhiA
MKLFELKDKNNKTTELFKIENFTTTKDVINKLHNYYNMIVEDECDSFYTNDVEKNFNYVYVSSDGFCKFVESLTEFSEGFQSKEDWKVNSSVEIC